MAFGEIFLTGYSGLSRAGKMSGSQSHHGICFILPACTTSHVIITIIVINLDFSRSPRIKANSIILLAIPKMIFSFWLVKFKP